MGWVFGVLAFLVLLAEGIALARSTDRLQPLTYYVRRLMERPMFYVALFLFWVWLGYHFFIEGRVS